MEGKRQPWLARDSCEARAVPAQRDMFRATLFFCSIRGVGKKNRQIPLVWLKALAAGSVRVSCLVLWQER